MPVGFYRAPLTSPPNTRLPRTRQEAAIRDSDDSGDPTHFYSVGGNGRLRVYSGCALPGHGHPASGGKDRSFRGLLYYPLNPCRLADTRLEYGFSGDRGPPSLAGQTSRAFPIVGQCEIPAAATAVAANLTVVPPSYLGFVTLYPGSVPLSSAGRVNVYVSNTTDVILDAIGYFTP